MVIDLTTWVKVKKKRPERKVFLLFLADFPEGIMTENGPRGPFKKGDLITLGLVGKDVARVLLDRNFAEIYVAG